jgi:hypothetical protein
LRLGAAVAGVRHVDVAEQEHPELHGPSDEQTGEEQTSWEWP